MLDIASKGVIYEMMLTIKWSFPHIKKCGKHTHGLVVLVLKYKKSNKPNSGIVEICVDKRTRRKPPKTVRDGLASAERRVVWQRATIQTDVDAGLKTDWIEWKWRKEERRGEFAPSTRTHCNIMRFWEWLSRPNLFSMRIIIFAFLGKNI